MSSAYMNFLHVVAGRSLMYTLKRVGAKSDHCGRPFSCILHELLMSRTWTRNCRCPKSSSRTLTAQRGRTLDSFTNRPLCHTVSCAGWRLFFFLILQLLGRFFSEIIRVRDIASHSLALGPRFFRNSGWMLSYPGAFPHVMFLKAASTSSEEMGVTVAIPSSSGRLL